MTSSPDVVSYGDWNLTYGEPLEKFTEEEARRRDAAGEEYWVIFGDPDHPWKVMRVSEGKVNFKVVWLDDLLRDVLSHLFVPEDKDDRSDWTQRLFLEQVHYKQYAPQDRTPPPRTGALNAGTTFFNHDGSSYTERTTGGIDEEGTSPPMDPADTEQLLFEPHYPTFGDWERITRRERDS